MLRQQFLFVFGTLAEMVEIHTQKNTDSKHV